MRMHAAEGATSHTRSGPVLESKVSRHWRVRCHHPGEHFRRRSNAASRRRAESLRYRGQRERRERAWPIVSCSLVRHWLAAIVIVTSRFVQHECSEVTP